MANTRQHPPHRLRDRPRTGATARQGRGERAPTAKASLDASAPGAGYLTPASNALDFNTVRNLVPLAQVLSRYGVLSQLKRSGSQLKGCCPIHDGNNPTQFAVNLTDGTWYCFGCNTGGGTLEFVAARERVSLSRAAALIAEWFGVPPPFRNLQQRRPAMTTRATHKVLAVTERPDGQGGKSYYTKIGVGFPIKNGAGLALQMDALPVNGRLIVLEITDDDRTSDAAERVEA